MINHDTVSITWPRFHLSVRAPRIDAMNDASDTDIRLRYVDSISGELLQPLVDAVSDAGIRLSVECRPQPGPFASLEWYVPTAAVLFLAKSYFDGFLKEAGKDHYAAVKKGLGAVWSVFFGDDRAVRISIVTSGVKKATRGGTYSLGLSVAAEAGRGECFKLLILEASTQEELESAIGTFLAFVERFHDKTLETRQLEELATITRLGNVFAVTYDRETHEIVILDPRPKPPSKEGA